MSDQFKTDIHPLPSFKTFEAISARIGNNSFSGFVVCLYELQNGTCPFFDEFQDLLENIISLHDNLYILGDFNLHLGNSNGNTNKFNEILTCFDLKQHVNFPTHVNGHWLDLLITKRISKCIKSVFSAAGISDHLAVISEIDCCKTKWNKEKISFRKILHRIPPPALPEFTSVKSFCDHLSRYFVDKIETIRSKFPDKVQNIPQVQKPEIRSKMNVFERASEDEIKKLILSSLSKTCDLDPIPTSVLKNCLDILITPITDIINISKETSTFPQNFKEAHVRPLLKKHLFLKTS